jgi:hypothetical protein
VDEPVLDHPGGAIGAFEAMAAMPAQGQRSIASAVEEEQGLLAPSQSLFQLPDQPRRQPAPARRRVLGKVERLDLGQLGDPVALGQLDLAIDTDFGHLPALDRRRGRGEHDRDPLQLGPHHRDVAGVILDSLLLLEAGLVRFVDDDQPEPGVGEEERGTGADHHFGIAARDRPPGAAALGLPEAGMPGDRLMPEARGEALQKRLGERDLGQQYQSLPALPKGFGHRLEIDFGLARSGDSVEQERRELG